MEKIESHFVNQIEYKIIKLLGHGKGGYSYLAEKAGSSGGEKVVVKQIHHEPCSYYTFGNKIEAEQNDYKRLDYSCLFCECIFLYSRGVHPVRS